jgi:ribonuclease BN (tRNA processing enzyme)
MGQMRCSMLFSFMRAFHRASVSLCLCASAFAATQVVILGSGTPVADPDRSGPAVAVIAGDRAYLFDAGPGVVRRASAAARAHGLPLLRAPFLRYVFLTHLHSDHTLGLPDLIFSPWVVGRQEPPEVYGPPGTKAMVDHIEAAWREDIDVRIHGLEHANATGYRAVVHEIEPGVVYRDGGVKITAFSVHHGSWPHAFGYRIDAQDRSIVISGDCAPSPPVVEACNGCDILLHEVYASNATKREGPDWVHYLHEFHTSSTEVGELATKAKPKLLVLYHLLTYGATDGELLDEVSKTYGGKVAVAHDLDVY